MENKYKNRTNTLIILIVFLVTCLLIITISQIFYYSQKSKELKLKGELATLKTQALEKEYPSYFLDVGTIGDDNKNNQIFLELNNDISDIKAENDITYRTLNKTLYSSFLYFKINASKLNLAGNGVPYKPAILEIGFKDVINETNCYLSEYLSSLTSICKPAVQVKLNYGKLDYYNIKSFGGLRDNNWKNQTIFIPNTPWQTLRSIDDFFTFRIIYTNRSEINDALPIDYINLTFLNEEEFNKLREIDRKNRGLNRTDYIETNTINPSDYDKNYLIYSRNYLEKIYPNTIPDSSEITNKLSSFEISGNYEPVTFSLYAFDDLKNIKLEVSDLINSNNKIDKNNIKIEEVIFLDKRWYYGLNKYYGTNPWYLNEFDSLNISENSNKQIWLTIYVPQNTPKGNYKGTITVSGENIEPSDIELDLEVFNLELGEADSTPYLFHSPFLRYYSNPQDIAAVNMKEHDVYPIVYINPKINPDYSPDFSNQEYEFQVLKNLGILNEKTKAWVDYKTLWKMIYGYENISYLQGNTSLYDNIYAEHLIKYKEFFNNYVREPVLMFDDEPANHFNTRISSSHLNKLAKQAGIETWVTYSPTCEEPLAGYDLSFSDNVIPVKSDAPSWILNDKNLHSYWDFSDNKDSSKNNYDLTLSTNAKIENGILNLTGYNSYAYNNSFKLSNENFTISLWFYIAQGASSSGYINFKYLLYSDGFILYQHYANDMIYFYGKGYMRTKWVPSIKQWHHLTCSVKNNSETFCFLDGVGKRLEQTNPDFKESNFIYISLGPDSSWNGSIDDIIIFNKSLSPSEQIKTIPFYQYYNNKQKITLSTTFDYSELNKKTLKFSLYDKNLQAVETIKELMINGEKIWNISNIDKYNIFEIDISPYLNTGQNTINFTVYNDYSLEENLRLYFIDDFWRNREWRITKSDKWDYNYIPDISGDLGPMDSYLDDKNYINSDITEQELDNFNPNKTFSFYTTYPGTQPVIVNNRFLHGIYASAIGADNVVIYAYGDWGGDPYDDANSPTFNLNTNRSLLSQNNYQLIEPSWDSKVLNTIVYESLREGIEDSKIILALKKAINEHPGAKANEAQAYLNSLFSKLSKNFVSSYRFLNLSAPIEKYADRSENILYDLSGNRKDYDFFDNMRKTMINYILELTSTPPTESSTPSGGGGGGGITTRKTNQTKIANQTNQTIPINQTRTNISINDTETPTPVKPFNINKFLKNYWIYIIIGIMFIISISIIKLIPLMEKNYQRKKQITVLRKNQEKTDKARELVQNLKQKGYSPEAIKKAFLENGWPGYLVELLVKD